MRATKNSKKMPQKFVNSLITKKSENKNDFKNKELKESIINKFNDPQNQNCNKVENNLKDNNIQLVQKKGDFKKEDYNLNIIEQNNFNNVDDNNNNIKKNINDFNDINLKENNENFNCEENKKQEEENNNYNFSEIIIDNIEYNKKCINDENNNEIKDIKINDNLNIFNANINKNDNMDEKPNKDENKEIENLFKNKEKEKIEIKENNENYDLPLIINNHKQNDIILKENKINGDENKSEKNINNVGQKLIETSKNKENIISNEIINTKEKNDKPINNNNENYIIENKTEKNSNINKTEEIKEEEEKELIREESYKDYILNTLAKLKKNNKLKPYKKNNKIINLSNKYMHIDKNKNNNIYFPIPNLIKIGKYISKKNNNLDIIRNNHLLQNPIRINAYTKTENIINKERINSDKKLNNIQLLLDKNKIKSKALLDVKFGIDENGNPLKITEFFDKENNEKGNKKLIAFIVQKRDKNKNYLIDKNGNFLEKKKDGDYLYKEGENCIIIKDFDVQHPELRIYGKRSITSSENKILSEKNTIESDNQNKISNRHFYLENENKNIINDNNKRYKSNVYLNKKLGEKYNKSFIHKCNITDLNDQNNILLNNINNNSYIKSDRKYINKIRKYRSSHSDIFENVDFDNMMSIWRKRYGNKNIRNLNQKQLNHYSNSVRNENTLVERTNSILKRVSDRKKGNITFIMDNEKDNIPLKYINNYGRLLLTKKYNIPIYNNYYKYKYYQNPLIKNYSSSCSKQNNPLLNNKNLLKRNIIKNAPSTRINIENSLFKNDFKNKKYFKLNKNKKQGKQGKQGKHFCINNNLLKNIIQKNKEKINNINLNTEKSKSSLINDYINKNMPIIKNKNNIKTNRNTVLSNEALKLVREFNKKQRENGKIIKKDNKLLNTSFINNNNFNNFYYIPIRYNNQNNKKKYFNNSKFIINSKINNNKLDNNLKSFSFSKKKNNVQKRK